MTIAQALAYGRRALNEMEPALVRALLDQYGMAWVYIDQKLTEVNGYIEAALARGEVVDDAWLHRQYWWQSTLNSIEVEMTRFTQGMASTLAQGEWQALTVAQQVGGGISEYVVNEASKRGISVTGSIRGQVNPGAFERWVLAQQPDSPIRKAIDAYGDRVSESVRTNMTQGLAAGEHPRTIANKIIAEVGEEANKGRIHTTTRTEIHRSFRGSLRDSMEAMGPDVVSGWRWSAALSRRTCAACLALHGTEYPFEAYPDKFHVACRCTIQPVVNSSLIPPRRTGQTGDEWLRSQPVAVQRQVLGNARYDAFQKGTPLSDFVGTHHDDVWGDSVYVKSVKEIAA